MIKQSFSHEEADEENTTMHKKQKNQLKFQVINLM